LAVVGRQPALCVFINQQDSPSQHGGAGRAGSLRPAAVAMLHPLCSYRAISGTDQAAGRIRGDPKPTSSSARALNLVEQPRDPLEHRRSRFLTPSMSLFPDQPPPASPPAKPKLTPEERRARQADRLTTIRLRMLIGRELEDRGITTPAAIGAALGMPAAEAVKLLRRHQWREGDVAQLQAAAAQLGVQRPGP
jgi:hypothetical protein